MANQISQSADGVGVKEDANDHDERSKHLLSRVGGTDVSKADGGQSNESSVKACDVELQICGVVVLKLEHPSVGSEFVVLGEDESNAGNHVYDYKSGEQEVENPLDLRTRFKNSFEVDEELALLLHHFKHPHQLGKLDDPPEPRESKDSEQIVIVLIGLSDLLEWDAGDDVQCHPPRCIMYKDLLLTCDQVIFTVEVGSEAVYYDVNSEQTINGQVNDSPLFI